MFRIKGLRDKILNNHTSNYVEYNPQNLEPFSVKFDELSDYIEELKSSLKTAESKTNLYQDIIQRYKGIVKEELKLYQLHRSNMFLLNQTIKENEIFISELEQEVRSFVEAKAENTVEAERFASFKRVLLRFIHQNKLCKTLLKQKLSELNETIEQKSRQLERMHGDIHDSFDANDVSMLSSQHASLTEACL